MTHVKHLFLKIGKVEAESLNFHKRISPDNIYYYKSPKFKVFSGPIFV